ncbi:hypothetical protein I4U23_017029 [Adineta vaga]|nr:hypothetical protein I4U23_017029 [Adineta vaga]
MFIDILLVSSLSTTQRNPTELANKFEGDIALTAGTATYGNKVDIIVRSVTFDSDYLNDEKLLAYLTYEYVLASTSCSPTTSCFPTSWNSSGYVVASGGYYGSLTVDDDFNVYVADGNQYRLQKWATCAVQPVNLLEGQFSHNPLFYHSSSRSLYYVDSILGNPTVYKLLPGQTVPVKVAFGNGVGNGLHQLQRNCRGLYVNERGDIYVLDAYNQRVLKWKVDANAGVLVAGGGGEGNGSNQLSDAHGLYVDTVNDVIYVADTGNHRIQKYTSGSVNGITVLSGAPQTATSTMLRGMYYPQAVFVDKIGNILVGDWARITKWAPNGSTGSLIADGTQGFNAIRMDTPSAFGFDGTGNLGITVAGYGNGSAGNTNNSLKNPYGLALDAADSLFVADYSNSRVIKFQPGSLNGIIVAGTGVRGTAVNQLGLPGEIVVDASMNVYINDDLNFRVMLWRANATNGIRCRRHWNKWNYERNFEQWNRFSSRLKRKPLCDHRIMKWAPNATVGTLFAGTGTGGNTANMLRNPYGLFLDENNSYIYVTDSGNARIQRFNLNNGTIGKTVAGGYGIGSNSSQLYNPYDVCVSKAGDIYIADKANHRIQLWRVGATTGITIIGITGIIGTNATLLYGPSNVLLSVNESFLYVSDNDNNRVQRYKLP